ncbi:HpcH/HpaI aldolase family protein [Flavisphingomonas formosensis]|uniref:HpcH/HpaI aldolase family protein n=1 Tax=Flavisphingomonas formosensis TaxID=861534 RepID=UPI0012F87CDA|nr:aldolase/citrate lyase family protein [Sphingomonas formosensis]
MTGASGKALSRLGAGETVFALWLSLGSPQLAELAAELDADAIVFDLQHGCWDRPGLSAAIALAMRGATPLVRVAANRPDLIGQALDLGAGGVIVPLVDSAEEAAAAVAAAHYPPFGCRSGGGMRPLADFDGYLAASRHGTLVSVMIETREALRNIAAIAAVPGVDLVFIGPGDLALALAEDADMTLERAIGLVLAACDGAGKACGIFTGSAEAARERAGQGFRFVVASDDIRLAREGLREALAAARATGSAVAS